MTDATRLTKLPSSTTIKEMAAETTATPAAEQKTIQTGIASRTDSFQVKQESSLFTANPNTGQVRFGDGVAGKRPPAGNSAALLQQSKSEISSYLKGDGKTGFLAMKEYLIKNQNEQIDKQMNEAREKADMAMNQATTGLVTGVIGGAISIGSAVDNLKHVASEAKSDLAHNPALEVRYKHFNALLNDLHTAIKLPESKVLQKRANLAQIEISKQEQAEQKADDATKASKGHRDNIRDAILDFLDKLHDIDPKI
jgi:hypothetical protein